MDLSELMTPNLQHSKRGDGSEILIYFNLFLIRRCQYLTRISVQQKGIRSFQVEDADQMFPYITACITHKVWDMASTAHLDPNSPASQPTLFFKSSYQSPSRAKLLYNSAAWTKTEFEPVNSPQNKELGSDHTGSSHGLAPASSSKRDL